SSAKSSRASLPASGLPRPRTDGASTRSCSRPTSATRSRKWARSCARACPGWTPPRRDVPVTPSTLFDKVWRAHEVLPETADTPAVLYIDLHLIHEVTSPQAFSVLRSLGIGVRRPQRTLATMDHSTPTVSEQVFGKVPIKVDAAAKQVRQLEQNAAEFGVGLCGMHAARGGSLRPTRRGW